MTAVYARCAARVAVGGAVSVSCDWSDPDHEGDHAATLLVTLPDGRRARAELRWPRDG